MTGHIPESFIEDLLSAVDIVQVIGARVELRKMGANYSACCPFHQEKTPSFTVSQTKQFYHCFGCGVHGDAIQFLMEHSGLHFLEAVDLLAARAGMTVPKDAQFLESESRYSAIYAKLFEASELFQNQLEHHPDKDRAIQYLKARGLTAKTVREFNLGFALPAWDVLVKALGKNQEAIQQLLAAGLIVAKENGRYYDRFRDRILFPIRDRRGRITGFGGRIIDKGEPKYLNSPETVVFHKSHQLYGLYEARSKNRVLESLVIVEGYLDVVLLAQFGITNVVATLGTALTEHHLEQLFRLSQTLYFCFDGDPAGREAARKALHLCLPEMKEGRVVRFVMMPTGEDPDSFVRKNGKIAFLNQLQGAKALSDFLFDCVSKDADLQTIEGRAALIRLARPLIMKLPRGVFQQMMLERLAHFTGYSVGALVKPTGSKFAYKSQGVNPSSKKSLPLSTAFKALSFLLKNRELLNQIGDGSYLKGVDTPGNLELCAIIEILRKDPNLPLEDIEKRLAEEYTSNLSLADLILTADSVPEGGVEAEFSGALGRLKERAQEQVMERLLQKAKQGLTVEEKRELRILLDQRDKTID